MAEKQGRTSQVGPTCTVCGESAMVSPEPSHHLCGRCTQAALLWAAQQARQAKPLEAAIASHPPFARSCDNCQQYPIPGDLDSLLRLAPNGDWLCGRCWTKLGLSRTDLTAFRALPAPAPAPTERKVRFVLTAAQFTATIAEAEARGRLAAADLVAAIPPDVKMSWDDVAVVIRKRTPCCLCGCSISETMRPADEGRASLLCDQCYMAGKRQARPLRASDAVLLDIASPHPQDAPLYRADQPPAATPQTLPPKPAPADLRCKACGHVLALPPNMPDSARESLSEMKDFLLCGECARSCSLLRPIVERLEHLNDRSDEDSVG